MAAPIEMELVDEAEMAQIELALSQAEEQHQRLSQEREAEGGIPVAAGTCSNDTSGSVADAAKGSTCSNDTSGSVADAAKGNAARANKQPRLRMANAAYEAIRSAVAEADGVALASLPPERVSELRKRVVTASPQAGALSDAEWAAWLKRQWKAAEAKLANKRGGGVDNGPASEDSAGGGKGPMMQWLANAGEAGKEAADGLGKRKEPPSPPSGKAYPEADAVRAGVEEGGKLQEQQSEEEQEDDLHVLRPVQREAEKEQRDPEPSLGMRLSAAEEDAEEARKRLAAAEEDAAVARRQLEVCQSEVELLAESGEEARVKLESMGRRIRELEARLQGGGDSAGGAAGVKVKVERGSRGGVQEGEGGLFGNGSGGGAPVRVKVEGEGAGGGDVERLRAELEKARAELAGARGELEAHKRHDEENLTKLQEFAVAEAGRIKAEHARMLAEERSGARRQQQPLGAGGVVEVDEGALPRVKATMTIAELKAELKARTVNVKGLSQYTKGDLMGLLGEGTPCLSLTREWRWVEAVRAVIRREEMAAEQERRKRMEEKAEEQRRAAEVRRREQEAAEERRIAEVRRLEEERHDHVSLCHGCPLAPTKALTSARSIHRRRSWDALCNVCGQGYFHGLDGGTAWSCAKCDWDICAECYEVESLPEGERQKKRKQIEKRKEQERLRLENERKKEEKQREKEKQAMLASIGGPFPAKIVNPPDGIRFEKGHGYSVCTSTGYDDDGWHGRGDTVEEEDSVWPTAAEAVKRASHVFYEQNPWGLSIGEMLDEEVLPGGRAGDNGGPPGGRARCIRGRGARPRLVRGLIPPLSAPNGQVERTELNAPRKPGTGTFFSLSCCPADSERWIVDVECVNVPQGSRVSRKWPA